MTNLYKDTPSIIPGDKYILRTNDDDPFDCPAFNPVTILDIKLGWVRYSMGMLFTDERMPIKTFLSIYRKIGDSHDSPKNL